MVRTKFLNFDEMKFKENFLWLCGLFEGEGCVYSRKDGRICIQITMTDKDVIKKAHKISGIGFVSKPRLLPSGKKAYSWCVTSSEDAAGFAMMLFPFMGKRRRKKIIRLLDVWKKTPILKRYKLLCIRGHNLFGDNLIIREDRRRCRLCINLRQREYNKRNNNATSI